jgi:glutathione S-transferase
VTPIELYQAEWCPHSRAVRMRLTELGLDFVARQVAAEPDQRTELEAATGSREIPVVVVEDGTVIAGEDEILDYLERAHSERTDAAEHRRKDAEKNPVS